ncbi:predicted protein [Botrytis cinerea T4]|uniref:Uncharacterized protein n=1 Tax=Botryotinia fuckeliana (strain T4) TaxID=999810 RepID=G2YAF0_BOTF4|nr:predicted protein [Botrytis cinerea T4]
MDTRVSDKGVRQKPMLFNVPQPPHIALVVSFLAIGGRLSPLPEDNFRVSKDCNQVSFAAIP